MPSSEWHLDQAEQLLKRAQGAETDVATSYAAQASGHASAGLLAYHLERLAWLRGETAAFTQNVISLPTNDEGAAVAPATPVQPPEGN